jgi:hypothetical protein
MVSQNQSKTTSQNIYHILGDIIYHLENPPQKTNYNKHFIFQQIFRSQENQPDYIKKQPELLQTFIQIVQNNQRQISNAQLTPRKFEKLLQNSLTKNAIETTIEKNIDIHLPLAEKDEIRNTQLEHIRKHKKQFIQYMVEGYRLHKEIEELQKTHPQYFTTN